MFDADQRLLVCNERYIEMYGLSHELAKPGTPFRTIVESRIANGLFAGDDPARYLEAGPYTHLRAHENGLELGCRLLLGKKKI